MPDNHSKSFYDEFVAAKSIEDFSRRILVTVNRLGFSDFLFMRTNKNWHSESHCGLLHSMADEWLQTYQQEGLFEHDLMISYAKTNTQPIFSSQIYGYIDRAPFEMVLTSNNRRLIHCYKRFGYLDQYCIPQMAANGSGHVMLQVCSVGICRQQLQTRVNTHADALRCLCSAIDEVSTKRHSASFIDEYDHPVVIGRRPLRSLSLFARSDLTINELAGRLFISPITAHNHIADARKALGVKTNIAAVVKAIKLGLISID